MSLIYIKGKLQANINEINSWYMGYILSFTLNIESLCLYVLLSKNFLLQSVTNFIQT